MILPLNNKGRIQMRISQIWLSIFVLILGLSTGGVAKSETPALKMIPMKWVPEHTPDIVLSNGFTPHRGFQGSNFRIEPIHRNLSPLDYKAWHDESYEDLRVLYGQAWDWPRPLTEAENASDLETKHYARFLDQSWISYEVLSLDGTRAYGSVYITPDKCGSYGGSAMYWITTPMRAEVEATFHAEMKQWLNTVWPWGTTYFPGPEVSDQRRGELYTNMENGLCI
jgi:hypothetical protein